MGHSITDLTSFCFDFNVINPFLLLIETTTFFLKKIIETVTVPAVLSSWPSPFSASPTRIRPGPTGVGDAAAKNLGAR
jgi:hypothetical protein